MAATPSLSRARVRLALAQLREGLPADLRAKVRLHIADAVGIALAATASGALPKQVLQGVSAGATGGTARVFGSAHRHAPAFAAYVNAALVHILDFDDIHDAARLHPTAVCLPAALAAAALVPSKAGLGAKVVDAVALGNELMCRLGVIVSPQGTGPGSDWFLTQLLGYFGGALASGIVLGLDEDELVSALGLAYMQAAGGKEAGFGVGSNARAVYPAFAAMGGVHAALLAQAGLVGPEGAFDGLAGLFKIYLGGATDAVLQHPGWHDGTQWSFAATEIKPWPSCRLSHPYVAAAISLREALGSARPQRIEVQVNGSAAKLCRPLAERRRPHTLQDAKYSIPYMVAFSLLHGRVALDNLDDRVLADPRLHALADVVEIDECLPDNPGHPPARIAIRTDDGRLLESRQPLPPFDPDAAAVAHKFAACLRAAGAPDEGAALWAKLAEIDTLHDLGVLFMPVDSGKSKK